MYSVGVGFERKAHGHSLCSWSLFALPFYDFTLVKVFVHTIVCWLGEQNTLQCHPKAQCDSGALLPQ